MKFHLTCFLFLFNAFLIEYSNSYKCCDQTDSKDCTCSDQQGGIGTCSCATSPYTRQGWFCRVDTASVLQPDGKIKIIIYDSVSSILFENK